MIINRPKQGRHAHGQKSKRIALRCPEKICCQLQDIANKNNVSLSAVVLAALKEFIANTK